jgi:exonuclease III
LKWLEREQPDVLALQETKIQNAEFPADALASTGNTAFSGQSSYNGVAILCACRLTTSPTTWAAATSTSRSASSARRSAVQPLECAERPERRLDKYRYR